VAGGIATDGVGVGGWVDATMEGDGAAEAGIVAVEANVCVVEHPAATAAMSGSVASHAVTHRLGRTS